MRLESVNHSDRAHAEFGPSSLKYVAGCAGYHGKEGTSGASEMGTRIHEALEIRDPSALQDEEEVEIYEQLIKDEEEVFAYVFGDDDDFVKVYREMRLTLDLDADTPTFGTCDIVAHDGKTALVADYKTGISFIDPPRENWQAMAYTLGVFQLDENIQTIHFAFLVPRNGGVIVGTFQREEMDSLRERISGIVKLAETTRPKWETGSIEIDDVTPSVNCRFCRHEDVCPALGALCIEVAKRYRPDLLPHGSIASSDINDPATMERLFVVAKIVEEWAGGIKHKAMSMSNDGVEFETLKRRSMGALKKTIEKNYLAQLAVKYGLDMTDVIEASDLTMGQISKALHEKTVRGKKSFVVDSFESEAIDLGIVEVGPTRYTLSSR